MATETETRRPDQTFRKGTIKASVWENTRPGRDLLQRHILTLLQRR